MQLEAVGLIVGFLKFLAAAAIPIMAGCAVLWPLIVFIEFRDWFAARWPQGRRHIRTRGIRLARRRHRLMHAGHTLRVWHG